MTYPYGMQGAPAVGGGLGGLPSRSTQPVFLGYTRQLTGFGVAGIIQPVTGAKYMRLAVIGAGGRSDSASQGGGGGGCTGVKTLVSAAQISWQTDATGTVFAQFPGYNLTAFNGSNSGTGGTGVGGEFSYTGGSGSRGGGGAAGPNGNGGNGTSSSAGLDGSFDGNGWGPGGGGGGGIGGGASSGIGSGCGGGGAGASGGSALNSTSGTVMAYPGGDGANYPWGTPGGNNSNLFPGPGGELGGGGGGDSSSPYSSSAGSGGIVVEWFG